MVESSLAEPGEYQEEAKLPTTMDTAEFKTPNSITLPIVQYRYSTKMEMKAMHAWSRTNDLHKSLRSLQDGSKKLQNPEFRRSPARSI